MAHSPIPGIGHFYSGALHPIVVPAQLMALLALGMLIGQRGIAGLGKAAVGLFVALGLGLLASEPLGSPDTDLLLLMACLLLALGIAIARPLPHWLIAVLAGGIGALLGLGSNPDGLVGGARWASLAGTWLGGSFYVLWIATITEAAVRPWLRIAVRVVASWLAASALLVLALSWIGPVRGGQPAAQAPNSVQAPSHKP